MKLKTLKDLGKWKENTDKVSKIELKQEAINWVKKMDLIPDDLMKGRVWFDFFNITEDDLK